MIQIAGNILVKQVVGNLLKKPCGFSDLLRMSSYTRTALPGLNRQRVSLGPKRSSEGSNWEKSLLQRLFQCLCLDDGLKSWSTAGVKWWDDESGVFSCLIFPIVKYLTSKFLEFQGNWLGNETRLYFIITLHKTHFSQVTVNTASRRKNKWLCT